MTAGRVFVCVNHGACGHVCAGLLDDGYQLSYLQQLDKWSMDSQVGEVWGSNQASFLTRPASEENTLPVHAHLPPAPPPLQVFMQLVQALAQRGAVELAPWQQALSGLTQTRVMLATAAASAAMGMAAGNNASVNRFGFDAESCFATLQEHVQLRVTGEMPMHLRGVRYCRG